MEAAAPQNSIPKEEFLFSFSEQDLDRISFITEEKPFCLINQGNHFVLEGYESLLLNTDSLMTLLKSFPLASPSPKEISSADIQIEIFSTREEPLILSLQKDRQGILLYDEDQTYFYPSDILGPLLSPPEDFIDCTVIASEFPQQASLTLSGTLHTAALRLSYYKEEQNTLSFCDAEEASTDLIRPLIEALCHLCAEQVVLLNPSSEDLQLFGFDEPFLSLDVQINEEKHSFHFCRPQADGSIYFIKEGTPLLYSTSMQKLPFLFITKETVLEQSLFQANYDDTTSLTVVTDELSYQFTKWDGQVLCQGKFVDENRFYDFYQLCTTLIPQQALILPTSEERSLLRLDFAYTNPQRRLDSIEFFFYNESSVLLSINGESKFLLKKSFVEEILLNCHRLLKQDIFHHIFSKITCKTFFLIEFLV